MPDQEVRDEEREYAVRHYLPDLDREWLSDPMGRETADAIMDWGGDVQRTLLSRRAAGPWEPVEKGST